MIEHLSDFPGNVVAFACKGHVTRHDYETVLVPVVEAALKQHEKIRLYYQIDPDFSGIEPGAMWEDFKVGMGHLLRWERIAVVTNVEWIRHTIQAFGFLMPGAVKIFALDEAATARQWIGASE
jgi:SpoIIAA-like